LTADPAYRHDDLVVGIGTADDAGVFVVTPELALVQTVDYFTPIVDDAADWGRIAAANALSDIYAMGATPLTALQIVGWPRDSLPFELLSEVLAGAAEVIAEAGCVVIGGHSIDDPEPKVGFAVTGTVHPSAVITNAAARDGDLLVLTKPLGTGVVGTAIKRGAADIELQRSAVATMVTLNRAARDAMVDAGASAATDVTGFGLLGHLGEMVVASGVGALVDLGAVPILDGVRDLVVRGFVPGGSKRNLSHAAAFTDFGASTDVDRAVLADAQTSGGLLIAAPPDAAARIVAELGGPSAVIGRIEADPGIRVR
jgi:selenide,water dikinase